jgi:hypothetical protein
MIIPEPQILQTAVANQVPAEIGVRTSHCSGRATDDGILGLARELAR